MGYFLRHLFPYLKIGCRSNKCQKSCKVSIMVHTGLCNTKMEFAKQFETLDKESSQKQLVRTEKGVYETRVSNTKKEVFEIS